MQKRWPDPQPFPFEWVETGQAYSHAIVYAVGIFVEDDKSAIREFSKNWSSHRRRGVSAGFGPGRAHLRAPDIRAQYTVGYAPSNQNLDSGYRVVPETVVRPHGEKYLARTTPGYDAATQGNTR